MWRKGALSLCMTAEFLASPSCAGKRNNTYPALSLVEVLEALCPFELLPCLAGVLSSRPLLFDDLTFSWGCWYKTIWNILSQHKPSTQDLGVKTSWSLKNTVSWKHFVLMQIQMQFRLCKEHVMLLCNDTFHKKLSGLKNIFLLPQYHFKYIL